MTTRRDKGSGSIYMRESDQMWVGYARTGEKGKRRYVYAKTKKEVSAKLKILHKEIDAGTLVTAKAQTVEAFLQYWLTVRRGRKDLKTSTTNNYEAHLHFVLPSIGQVKLTKLTTDTLQQMFNTLLDTRLPSTVHAIHTTLSTAFNDALKWKKMTYNPCKDVDLPHVEKHEAMVLTGEQALHLMDTAKGHELECFITVALATGLRRGELLALKWSDISFEEKTLKVTATLVYVHDELGNYQYVATTPKTKAGKRTVKLAQFAVNALKEHRTRQLEQRLRAGATWKDTGWVFCKANGEHLMIPTLARHFKKLVKSAELPDMRIHDLRHSAATLLLSKGVSMKVVQEILGHADFATTANIYAHVLLELQSSAMDQMDGMFLRSL